MVSRPEEVVDALPAVQLEHQPYVRKASMLQDPSQDGRGALLDVDFVGIEVPQKPAKLSGNGSHLVIVARRAPCPAPDLVPGGWRRAVRVDVSRRATRGR